MLGFFRRIRRNSIGIDADEQSEVLPEHNQNKAPAENPSDHAADTSAKRAGRLRKYLTYGIGEILLVVIGILIALQINNWNQDRIDRQREQVILKSIRTELDANYQYFESLKEFEEKKAAAMLALLQYLGPVPEPIVPDSFYVWFVASGDIPPFAPKNAILTDVTNSDQLQLILDEDLKNILTEYHAQLNHLAEDYRYRIDYWKMVINPYQIAHMSSYEYRKFYPEFRDIPARKFKWDINQVMADPVFENIVLDVYSYAADLVGRLEKYLDLMASIRVHIEENQR